jgi:hypothetical protein
VGPSSCAPSCVASARARPRVAAASPASSAAGACRTRKRSMAFRRGGPLLGAVVPAVSCVGVDAGGAGDADAGVGGGGSPEQLARNAVAVAPASRWRREVFALILLVTGLPPILGWLAGVGLRCGRRARSCSESWCGRRILPRAPSRAFRTPDRVYHVWRPIAVVDRRDRHRRRRAAARRRLLIPRRRAAGRGILRFGPSKLLITPRRSADLAGACGPEPVPQHGGVAVIGSPAADRDYIPAIPLCANPLSA